MSRYGLICDGINDYLSSANSALDISTIEFAFAQFVNLEAKSSPNDSFHYLLSTGSFVNGEFQLFFRQSASTSNTLGFTLSANATATTSGAYPDLIGTEHLLVAGRNSVNRLTIILCPVGGTAVSENVVFDSTNISGKTWQWMRRGDANTARYAKGTFSHPMRFTRLPTLAEAEDIASGVDPLTVMGADAVINWAMPDGVGTTTTDTEIGAILTQNNMPTDGTQWVLLDGGGEVTVSLSSAEYSYAGQNANIELTGEIDAILSAASYSYSAAPVTVDLTGEIIPPLATPSFSYSAQAVSVETVSAIDIDLGVSSYSYAAQGVGVDLTGLIYVDAATPNYNYSAQSISVVAQGEIAIDTGVTNYSYEVYPATITVVVPYLPKPSKTIRLEPRNRKIAIQPRKRKILLN